MANVKFNRSSSRATALASKDGSKVFFPNDSSAVVMGGKEYGMSPCAVRSSAVTATTGGTTAGRFYGVERDSDGRAFVNVPWSDTTYTNLTLGQGFATCSTAASTAAKIVLLTSYRLVTNGVLAVRFTNAVCAGATMNVNSCGTKYIYHNGAQIKDGVIGAGDTAIFMYCSAYYHLLAVISSVKEIDLTSFFSGSSAVGTSLSATGGNDSFMCMHRYVAVENGSKVPVLVSKESGYVFFYYISGFSTSGLYLRYVKFSIGSSMLSYVESGVRGI